MLVFYLKQRNQLAIVDLVEAKIVHFLDAPDDFCFAAGSDSLLIAVNGQKLLNRYSLKTFQREKTIPVPLEGSIRLARMGCSSQGPLLLVSAEGRSVMVDPATLKPISTGQDIAMRLVGDNPDVRVSADGQTFTARPPGKSPHPNDYRLIRFSGKNCTVIDGKNDDDDGQGLLQPTADGSLLLQGAPKLKILSNELKPIDSAGVKDAYLAPTDDPDYFLALNWDMSSYRNDRRAFKKNLSVPTQVSICAAADCRPVFTLPHHLEAMTFTQEPGERGRFKGQPRVRFLPVEKLLVTLPNSDDLVVVRTFDLADELKKAGQEKLLVLSRAKAAAAPGSTYNYSIRALSTAGGVKYQIKSGPAGMTVSANGLVRWQVPAKNEAPTASVTAAVTDAAGKEVLHSFNIAVARPQSGVPLPAAAASDKPAAEQKPPLPQKPVDANGQISTTIKLPHGFSNLCCGGEGRYLIFHTDGERSLTVVDLVAEKIVREIPLPGERPLFAAGREKLMIVFPELNLVQRL